MLSEDRVDLGPRINRRLASVVMIKRVGTLAKRRWSADGGRELPYMMSAVGGGRGVPKK